MRLPSKYAIRQRQRLLMIVGLGAIASVFLLSMSMSTASSEAPRFLEPTRQDANDAPLAAMLDRFVGKVGVAAAKINDDLVRVGGSSSNQVLRFDVDRAANADPRLLSYLVRVNQSAVPSKVCDPNFSKATIRTFPEYVQCTHTGVDVVSSYLHKDGYWRDCLMLAGLATFARKFSPFSPPLGQLYTALDVGGNIGSCAMLLASRGFHVTSFEPVAKNVDAFRRSIAGSGYQSNVTLIHAAASTTSFGTSVISVEEGNNGNGVVTDAKSSAAQKLVSLSKYKTEVINLVRIDDIVDSIAAGQRGTVHVHFCKMDCQGSEFLALKGAERTLVAQHRIDVLLIEIDTRLSLAVGNNAIDILTMLRRYKYSIFFANDVGDGFYGKSTGGVLPPKSVEPNATPPPIRSYELLEEDFEPFVEYCKDHPSDVVAVSPPMLRAVGALAVMKVFSPMNRDLSKWLMEPSFDAPQPGL